MREKIHAVCRRANTYYSYYSGARVWRGWVSRLVCLSRILCDGLASLEQVERKKHPSLVKEVHGGWCCALMRPSCGLLEQKVLTHGEVQFDANR